MPFRAKRPFSAIYPNATAEAVDLLELTLRFDPKKRLTAEQCLAHPYLANYRELSSHHEQPACPLFG